MHRGLEQICYTFAEVLAYHSATRPEMCAFTFLGSDGSVRAEITFAELYARASVLAARMLDQVEPGARVALICRSGQAFVEGVCACLLAGLVAVPANVPRRGQAANRQAAIARDVQADLALTLAAEQEHLQDMMRESGVGIRHWLAIDGAACDSGRQVGPGPSPDSVAMIQYTSGTTGTPRGVVLTQANLIHNQQLVEAAFGHDDETIFVTWLPMHHDMGLIGSVLHPIYLGVRSVQFAPEAFLRRPALWLQAISRYRGTTSGGPNFAFNHCVERIDDADLADLDISSWTVAFNGSEPIDADTLERFATRFAACGFRKEALFPCYGMAESTLFIAGGHLDPERTIQIYDGDALAQGEARPALKHGGRPRRLVGCGRPAAGTHVAIVDPTNRTRCQAGRIGEIWLQSPSVGLGYWGNVRRSATTFRARCKGERKTGYLRTGDLGFLTADGQLVVTGRRKEILILHGRNLQPQDIENSARKSCQSLGRIAAAFTLDGPPQRLVLLLEVARAARRQADDPDRAAAIIDAIRQAVWREQDLVPDVVALVPPGALPRTTSGKLQRTACRELYEARELACLYVDETSINAGAAAGAKDVREIVAAVLGVPPARVEPDRPLISQGVDSLKAATVAARLSNVYGRELGADAVLTATSLTELTDACRRAPASEPDRDTRAGEWRDGRRQLQPIEQSFWFLQRAQPQSAIYNLCLPLWVRPALQPEAFRRAVAALIDRHPLLHAWITTDDDGQPYFSIDGTVQPVLRLHDATGWSDAALREIAAQTVRRPYDLDRGPLARIDLYQRPGGSLMLLGAHHMVSDLGSLAVMLRDLLSAYEAEHAGTRPRWPEAVRYTPPASAGAASAAYWTSHLAGAPQTAELPLDRPYPPTRSSEGRRLTVPLSPVLTAGLRALCARSGVTLFAGLLALYRVLMYRYTGQRDALVGAPVRAAEATRNDDRIGCFVNTLALRCPIDPRQPFADLLKRAGTVVLNALRHGAYPFHRLVADMNVPRDPGVPPLVQTMLALQQLPLPALLDEAAADVEIGSLSLSCCRLDSVDLPFDLGLMVVEAGDCLLARWEFLTDVLEPGTVARLGRHFVHLAEAAVAEPARPVASLPMLDAEDCAWLDRHAHTPEAPDEAPEACLNDDIERQATRTPDAPAVRFGETTLSYADLVGQAERAAAALRVRGVAREQPVGVLMRPTPQLIVAMLAIWKAGGIYVPLDPDAPVPRLEAILDDVRGRLVLVDGETTGLLPATDDHPVISWETVAAARTDGAEALAGAGPDNLAYVIYTSGSTGTPKGVMISHRAARNFGQAQRAVLGHAATRQVLQVAPTAFDASISDVLMALPVGGTLVLAPEEARLPGAPLARLIECERITLITAAPSLLNALPMSDYGALEAVISTAEVCPVEVVRRWSKVCRVFNGYGPTETTIGATIGLCGEARFDTRLGGPSIGRPFAGYEVRLLDRDGNRVPTGAVGEICIGGRGLARGYVGRPALTAERFVPDSFASEPGARQYRTGDLGRVLANGELEFLGRRDGQVQVRGFRVEPGEVGAAIARLPEVADAYVAPDGPDRGGLVAYVAPAPRRAVDEAALRGALRRVLPAYMVPARIIPVTALPREANGKVDRRALRAAPPAARAPVAPAGIGPEATGPLAEVAQAWRTVLDCREVGVADNFFDLGGHSLLLPKLQQEIARQCGREIALTDFFAHPTVLSQARLLAASAGGDTARACGASRLAKRKGSTERAVAIIGMAGRLPDADDLAQFWRNLAAGHESIRRFGEAELLAAGVDPETVGDPAYVPARGILEGIELFDAACFGFTPQEAKLLDPQVRLLLECAQHALDDAGYGGTREVGVFVGTSRSGYAEHNLASRPDLLAALGRMMLAIAGDSSFTASMIGYRLDLTGPCITVDTACSTSLVAVHQAVRAVLADDCPMALAGGASIDVPVVTGHRYEDGGIASPDGRCRAFDAEASGTVKGMGGGVVVLKCLDRALADGDRIRAVILGSAINNDGGRKLGFTAPAIDGQAAVIAKALAAANVSPESIGYVEAHGTGTALGDPVEVAALNAAFGELPRRHIALGSLKSNIGHLDAAAGVASLIKCVLALEHGELPASLHVRRPNPKVPFADGPFYVNTDLRPWPERYGPRRAGVSSFGIGGTNAHLCLEEAPPGAARLAMARPQLFMLSAHTGSALRDATSGLAQLLQQHDDTDLGDAAFTLACGRRVQAHRQTWVAGQVGELIDHLLADDAPVGADRQAPPPVVFLFPGQSVQKPGMVAGLLRHEPVFRQAIDRCAAELAPLLDIDLRDLLDPPSDRREVAAAALHRTAIAQPVLFAVSYALCRYLESWGIRPAAMLGHGLGEWVAACEAGVFELPDALRAVVARGRLMEVCEEGAMLTVGAGEDAVRDLLVPGVEVAAVNGGNDCRVAGPPEAIAAQVSTLRRHGIASKRLDSPRAFHSAAMDPAAAGLREVVAGLRRGAPAIPFASNVTGAWIGPEEAADHDYWARHACAPVQFGRGLATVLEIEDAILLEVGPGNALTALARRGGAGQTRRALATLPPSRAVGEDLAQILTAVGRLWELGVPLEAAAYYRASQPELRRCALPGTVFERQRHWIDPPTGAPIQRPPVAVAIPQADAGAGRAVGESAADGVAPESAALALSTAATPVADPDAVAATVRATWRELLGVDEIGPTDDYFTLGGDSLLALRLAARLSQALGTTVSASTVLETPVFNDLVATLSREPVAMDASGGADDLPAAPAGPSPLSVQQTGLWLAQSLAPDSGVFGLPLLLEIEGAVDASALQAAFRDVLHRHAVLRSAMREGDGEPVMEVARAPGSFVLSTSRVSVEEADRLAMTDAEAPFDLAADWLVRARLLALPNDRHRLLVTLHHIVADGWSSVILLRDLAAAYATRRAGRAPERPRRELCYADFVAWQRRQLESDGLGAQRSYWRRQLADVTPLALPSPPSGTQVTDHDNAGEMLDFDLGAELSAALRDLARALRTTPFVLLLAGFKALLHGLTDQSDMAIGTPAEQRGRPEFEEMVGLFINILLLRTRVAGALSFEELVARVRRVTLDAFENRDVPFEHVVEDVGLTGAQAGTVFPVAFAIQNRVDADVALAGTRTVTASVRQHRHARFALTVWIADGGDAITGALEYRFTRLAPETVQRMADDFVSLLAAAVADPTRTVDDLTAERSDARDIATVSVGVPVHHRIAAQAARTPDAVAVSAEAGQLTYRELEAAADRLADRLADLGVGPDTPVGLCLERGLDLSVGLLSILKAGGCFVPLQPDLPPARLALMTQTAGVQVVLTIRRHVPLLTPEIASVPMDADPTEWPAAPARASASGEVVGPDHLAYIMFTSGSTGVPKGVMVPHGALANRLEWMLDAYGFQAGERVLQKTPIGFDVSVWELLCPLMVGATLVTARPEGHRDPAYLSELIRRAEIAIVHFVPSMLQAFLEQDDLGAHPALRLVVCSGEGLSSTLQQRFEAAFGTNIPRLVNLYGPTEAAIDVSAWSCDRPSPTPVVPIGWPIWNTELQVLDSAERPVGDGEIGEIYISGQGLARGYVGQPGLTAERFVPDPFGTRPSARMYRTGDLGRRLSDGAIEYVGRNDQQVKLHGIRVELGEIESTLAASELVAEAAAVVQRGQDGDTHITAFVVPDRRRALVIHRLAALRAANADTPPALTLLKNTLAVFCDNPREADFQFDAIFTRALYLRHGIAIRDGACVLDVGANIGLFSVFAAFCAERVSVHAFEPDSGLAAQLERNLALYAPDASVTVCALAEHEGRAAFTSYPNNSMMSGLHANAEKDAAAVRITLARRHGATAGTVQGADSNAAVQDVVDHALTARSFEVRLSTVSAQIDRLGLQRIDLLKIDVERAELRVLQGIREVHWPRIGQVVAEVEDQNMEAVRALLDEQGFEVTVEADPALAEAGLYYVYAGRPGLGHQMTTRQQPRLPRWVDEDSYRLAVLDVARERLPASLVPVLCLLDVLPKTRNGKLDRNALSEPVRHRDGGCDSATPTADRPVGRLADPAAASATEERLIELWRELLPDGPIHRDSNFFALGGHSLRAAKLAVRIRQAFGASVDIATVFDHPIVADLARVVDIRREQNTPAAPATFQPAPEARFEPFPLTPLQRAYLSGRSGAIEIGSVATHGYLEIDLDDLDVARFTDALNQLVARHDMLRAVVVDEVRQRILREVAPYRPSVVDLSGIDAAERDAALAAIREEMSHAVADPTEWPLFDVRVTRLCDRQWRVHFGMDAMMVDGQSLRVIERDLEKLYRASDHDAPPPVPAVVARDYVMAVHGERSGGAYAKAKAYWLDRLDDLPPAPELPLRTAPRDLVRPRFTRRSHALDAAAWSGLKARARTWEVTPAAVLLAVYAEVLATWCNRRHFTLNLPVSERLPATEGVEELVGNFTSVVLLEVDLRAAMDLATVARNLQAQLWHDLAHLRFDGVEVQSELARRGGDFTRARMPIVFTGMLGDGGSDSEGAGRFALDRQVYGVSQTSQVLLDCLAVDSGATLTVSWDAVEAAFPTDLLAHMFQAYVDRIVAIAHNPLSASAPTPGVPACQLAKRPQPSTGDALGCGLRLHDLIARAARKAPEKVAVVGGGRQVSYAELERWSDVLAGRLRALGAGRERLVGVLMDKGWEQIVAALSVLKTGAAYLPIDAAIGEERQRELLTIGEVEVVLTQPHLATEPSLAGLEVLIVDDTLDNGPAAPFQDTSDPADLAYVIFTSGSTGTPKGVMIEHRAVVNTILDINARFGVGASDSVLSVSGFGFDLSVYDVFGLLAAGGTVVLPELMGLHDPAHWHDLARAHGVSVWNSVPALLDHYAAYLDASDATPHSTLRLAMLSGDWIPLDLPERLSRLWPTIEVVSLGGATEASIWSIFHRIGAVDAAWQSIPYGRALAQQDVLVLDARLAPCPDWVTGDIYIGGSGLKRGYWKDPEKTRASFVVHPETGRKLYRTGDLGRYMDDGSIEFLGRNDAQIKIHGQRIELGEVESLLQREPCIRRAAVVAERVGREVKRLVGFLVLEEPEAARDQPALQDAPAVTALVADRDHARATWAAAVDSGRDEAATPGPDDPDLLSLSKRLERLESQYRSALCRTLAGFGLSGAAGQTVTLDEIMSAGRIAPRYRRWLDRGMAYLQQLGALERRGELVELRKPLLEVAGEAPAPTDIDLPAQLCESTHSAENYAREETAAAYQEIFAGCHRTARAVVSALAAAGPDSGAPRVLEVGAGFGSLTEHVLAALPREVTYVFTDISQFFLIRARNEFADWSNLRFGLLNLDTDPQLQGYGRHGYDLILASSVLHNVRDLRAGLTHLRTLLAPGGLLLMIEETRFYPFFDLGMGLQQGFDDFHADDLRKTHPLLSRADWSRALVDAGFAQAEVLNAPRTPSDLLGFDVIVAQAPRRIVRVDADVLARALERRLPRGVAPRRYVVLDRLPLTANGKVDRSALELPQVEESVGAPAEPPASAVERDVAAIWCETLGREAVGRHDDFFDLGGDSLLASRIAVSVREYFGISLPISAVFEAPTIEELAAIVEIARQMAKADGTAATPGVNSVQGLI